MVSPQRGGAGHLLSGLDMESDSPNYVAADQIVLSGWSFEEKYRGGYTQCLCPVILVANAPPAYSFSLQKQALTTNRNQVQPKSSPNYRALDSGWLQY